jgi:hypothetical protein
MYFRSLQLSRCAHASSPFFVWHSHSTALANTHSFRAFVEGFSLNQKTPNAFRFRSDFNMAVNGSTLEHRASSASSSSFHALQEKQGRKGHGFKIPHRHIDIILNRAITTEITSSTDAAVFPQTRISSEHEE